MNLKQWLLLVLSALVLVLIVCVCLNLIVDPFGAFGGSLRWDSYAQTLNPRNAKAVYLAEHPDSYDSFVVGSSSAASYLPETLEKYYGGSFYNLFHYGADSDYDCALVRWLLRQGSVRTVLPRRSSCRSEPARRCCDRCAGWRDHA